MIMAMAAPFWVHWPKLYWRNRRLHQCQQEILVKDEELRTGEVNDQRHLLSMTMGWIQDPSDPSVQGGLAAVWWLSECGDNGSGFDDCSGDFQQLCQQWWQMSCLSSSLQIWWSLCFVVFWLVVLQLYGTVGISDIFQQYDSKKNNNKKTRCAAWRMMTMAAVRRRPQKTSTDKHASSSKTELKTILYYMIWYDGFVKEW